MIKHSSSHAASIIVTSISSAILLESIRPTLPKFFEFLTSISEDIIQSLSLPLQAEFLNIILVASIIGGFIGVVAKLLNWYK